MNDDEAAADVVGMMMIQEGKGIALDPLRPAKVEEKEARRSASTSMRVSETGIHVEQATHAGSCMKR